MKFPVLLLLAALAAPAQESPIQVSDKPLSSDQIAIYKDFLGTYTSEEGDHKFVLNVADTTVPLSIDNSDRNGCARGITRADIALTQVSVHRLPAELNNAKVRLVDSGKHRINDPGDAIRRGRPVDDAVDAGFRAGIFTFSEIAFDHEHQMAAFLYSFRCGRLCGHGGLVVYQMRLGKWHRSKHECGGWVS